VLPRHCLALRYPAGSSTIAHLRYSFVLATQLFRTADDWRGFVWFIMFFGFLVAIFGILQHLTFNGKLYWFREMRFGAFPSALRESQSLRGFRRIGHPTALVPLVLGKVRRERRFAVVVFALLPVVALFLAASRGGIVSFAAEIGVLTLLLALRRAGGRHVLAGGGLAAGLHVGILVGVRQILERFSSMQSLEVTGGKRASMRHDSWRIFRDHPWTAPDWAHYPSSFPPTKAYTTQSLLITPTTITWRCWPILAWLAPSGAPRFWASYSSLL